MLLTKDHPKSSTILVFLDGKWIRSAVAADDVEGWVEIMDISAISPLEGSQNNPWKDGNLSDKKETSEAPLLTKKLYGKVEFKEMKTQSDE